MTHGWNFPTNGSKEPLKAKSTNKLDNSNYDVWALNINL